MLMTRLTDPKRRYKQATKGWGATTSAPLQTLVEKPAAARSSGWCELWRGRTGPTTAAV